MGQRHNRRRTRRPRAGKRVYLVSNPSNAGLYVTNSDSPPTINGSTLRYLLPSSCAPRGRCAVIPSAQIWHNWDKAWQNWEAAGRDEGLTWKDERYRLFGGQPGDDESLCDSMLEFFGKLDYIDT